VSLLQLLIESVTHGLAINDQTFVLRGIHLVPAAQHPIQMLWVYPNEVITQHILSGAQPPASGATQNRAGSDGQDCGQTLPPTLSPGLGCRQRRTVMRASVVPSSSGGVLQYARVGRVGGQTASIGRPDAGV
jgi:hypothetical protein